jgi:hypothetical protein
MPKEPQPTYSELLQYLSIPRQFDELLKKMNDAQAKTKGAKQQATPGAITPRWEQGQYERPDPFGATQQHLEDLADSLLVKPTPSAEPLPTVTLRFSSQHKGTTINVLNDLVLEVGAQVTIQDYSPEGADLNIKVISINLPEPRKPLDPPDTEFNLHDLHEVRGHFSYQGLATTCVMADRTDRVVTSLARCHPDDVYDAPTGRKLAFGRALQKLIESPYSRAVVWGDYFSHFPLDRTTRRGRS